MDVLETIARRTSVRDYLPEPLPDALLEDLRLAGERAHALSDAPMRIHLVRDGARIEGDFRGVIGNYGKVIHAPHYLVLTTPERGPWLLDAGFRFEQLVLAATARGVGTCWVGGFFREGPLQAALGVGTEERVVALTPVGLPAGAKSVMGRALRRVIGADGRLPLEAMFFGGRAGEPLPAAVRADERCGRLFEAVRRAPSWSNKQPWRFVVRPEDVLVYKQARQVKEGKDYHLVDCGIALAHLHLAAGALGLVGECRLDVREIPGAPDAEAIGRYVFSDRWLPSA